MRVEVSSIDDQHLEVAARDMRLPIDRFAEQGAPSEGFRATELLLGGLGACMVGTALEFARRQGLDITGISLALEERTAAHPTRVGEIAVTMTVDGDVSERDLERLGRVAARCKIHNTLRATSEPIINLAVEQRV